MSLAKTSMVRRCGGGTTPSSSGGSYVLVHGDLRFSEGVLKERGEEWEENERKENGNSGGRSA
eukprot:scaffold33276_cov32-Tisochrysis_lutea.AAC.1